VSTTTEAIRNGVDTEQLFGTLDAIKANPSLARFQFRARNRWIDGAHNQTRIRDFYAANQEDTSRAEEFVIDAGEPAILLGNDTGPNPAEYLLHALAACLTTSLVYVAAARGVQPPRRSCERSSPAHSSARPSSTWSPTASRSRWTWRLRD
jgi:hypothetical protein